MPPFCNHIENVIPICTKKQMIRVNASSIIARMQNPEARWNGTTKPRICPSVSMTVAILAEPSVTVLAYMPSPVPAAGYLVNLMVFKKFG